MTRVLFLGDVFSKAGRALARNVLPMLIETEKIDLALANAENAAGGVGLSVKSARQLLNAGLAALSGGNHTFKHEEIKPALEGEDSRLIRPANYPEPCPGKGFIVLEAADGVKVGFGNLMGRLFVNSAIDCPFARAESLIAEMAAAGATVTIIDFHAEATSEKKALGFYLDGKLGALLGTHTHVQTNDAQIFPGGLAYITDVGMTGPHGSVIGMIPDEPIAAFISGRLHRFKPSSADPILEGVIIDFNPNGSANSIKAIRVRDQSGIPIDESSPD